MSLLARWYLDETQSDGRLFDHIDLCDGAVKISVQSSGTSYSLVVMEFEKFVIGGLRGSGADRRTVESIQHISQLYSIGVRLVI